MTLMSSRHAFQSLLDSVGDLGEELESPYSALRATTPVALMREHGTFFTSASMAASLWQEELHTLANGSVVVDPACGAGDLLLPVADYLSGQPHLKGSVEIRALDRDDHFVRVALSRLNALSKSNDGMFNGQVSDLLRDQRPLRDATHVVLNPPFVQMKPEHPVAWSGGKVNSAALFLEVVLRTVSPNTKVLAILPDVLRSGTRYAKWRAVVDSLAYTDERMLFDQFDNETDVHVFGLRLRKRPFERDGATVADWTRDNGEWSDADPQNLLSSICTVRVGPVVPHRDPDTGDVRRFLTARNLSSGIIETIRTSKRVEVGPMLLVSRTSRPGQLPRARTRVWLDPSPVAIENHLIVVKPLHGLNASLEQLREYLESSAVSRYFDHDIRCRHLTVSVMRNLRLDL